MSCSDSESINQSKPRMTNEEPWAALGELTAEGLVEWENDDELTLTDRGAAFAFDTEQKLTPKERWVLELLYEICRQGPRDV